MTTSSNLVNPFFLFKERGFSVYNIQFTLYKPFTVKFKKEKIVENPSFIISLFFAITATLEFGNFIALSCADHALNFMRLKVTPIGTDYKLGLITKKATKSTFIKLCFDEVGLNAKNYAIISAQNFQNSINFFPLQFQNVSSIKILDNDSFLKVIIPIQELFFKSKKGFTQLSIWSVKKINIFIQSRLIEQQIQKLNKSFESVEETLELLKICKLK